MTIHVWPEDPTAKHAGEGQRAMNRDELLLQQTHALLSLLIDLIEDDEFDCAAEVIQICALIAALRDSLCRVGIDERRLRNADHRADQSLAEKHRLVPGQEI